MRGEAAARHGMRPRVLLLESGKSYLHHVAIALTVWTEGIHDRLVNHSCANNCGVRIKKDKIVYVALRDLTGPV